MNLVQEIKIILRSIGQIMLQENVMTGFFFLIGVAAGSILLSSGLLCGAIISTYSAKIFGYNHEEINKGLYGFNGGLVGVAILFFYPVSFAGILLLVVGSILSTLVMKYTSDKLSVPPIQRLLLL